MTIDAIREIYQIPTNIKGYVHELVGGSLKKNKK